MTDVLRLTGDATVDLTAAASGGKAPQISIMAYGGGVMSVAPFGPLAIDLAALETPATIPLLADHNEMLAGVIGSGVPTKDGSRLSVAGTLADTPAAQQIIGLAKAGVPLSASVGVEIQERRRIDGGKIINANGRSITAPASGYLFITRGRLREISVVVSGADSSASVSIAAKAQTMPDEIPTSNPSDGIAASLDATLRAQYISSTAQAVADEFPDHIPEVRLAAAKALRGEITDREFEVAMERGRRFLPRPSPQPMPSHADGLTAPM